MTVPSLFRSHSMACTQNDLSRMVQIREIHPLHRSGEWLIFSNHVQFVITHPASDVQIRRSDTGPAAIDNRGFRMQHGTIPLKNPHPGFQQRPISHTRQAAHYGNIAGSR